MENKCKTSKFVPWLLEKAETKCGYLMGTYGQDPKTIPLNSWTFTQYKDRKNYSAAQEAKALYWRKNAPFVFDCAGMAEGYVSQTLGLDIKKVNTKARYIYAEWCSVKSTDMSKLPLLPGISIYKYNKTPSDIHHIGFLVAPVNKKNPDGDWYVVEAKGVNYGVVKTNLKKDSKWNAWGYMDKYFEYDAKLEDVEEEKEPEKEITDKVIITGNRVNIRKGAGTEFEIVDCVDKDTVFEYANSKNWIPILIDGKVYWVSPQYSKRI